MCLITKEFIANPLDGLKDDQGEKEKKIEKWAKYISKELIHNRFVISGAIIIQFALQQVLLHQNFSF